ncbi:MAG TPA: helix-hairpin-helix domain-containing protein [Pyrinomonadaceae bacterium]
MKQSPLPARYQTSLTVLVLCALALSVGACATQSRSVSSEVRARFDASKANRGSLININTASSQELDKLPGIGKVVAERIIAHRQQYGPFRRAEHLMMVRGISDRKFREMRVWIVAE